MTKRHWRKSELFDALRIDEDAKVINGKTIDDLLAEYLDPNWESLNLEDIAFIPYIKVQCFLCRIKGGYPYDADHMMFTITSGEATNSRGKTMRFEPESKIANSIMAMHQAEVHASDLEQDKTRFFWVQDNLEQLSNPSLIKPEYKTIDLKIDKPDYVTGKVGEAIAVINAGEYQSTSYGSPRRDYAELMRTYKWDIAIESFDEHTAEWRVVRDVLFRLKEQARK